LILSTSFLFSVVLAAPVEAQQREEPPSKSCGANSENQRGGQTACLIVNNGAPRNPQLEKLAAAMVLMNGDLQKVLDQPIEGGGYYALYDPADPAFANADGEATMYVFFAGAEDAAEDFVPAGHQCAFEDEKAAIGAAISGRPGRQLAITARLLRADDRLLRQVCRGLGAKSSVAVASGSDHLTNFDMVAGELTEIAVIMLIPSAVDNEDFEQRSARSYWAGLISPMEPMELVRAILKKYGGLEELVEEINKKGKITVAIDVTQSAFGPVQPISPEALRAFGPAIRDMDSKWSSFLQRATVTVDGTARPVVVGGRYARLMQRFRADQLAGDAFWNSLEDGNDYTSSLSCLATRFTVDNQYGSLGELPAYRKCTARALRAEQRQ
jgi:hypothetical protein